MTVVMTSCGGDEMMTRRYSEDFGQHYRKIYDNEDGSDAGGDENQEYRTGWVGIWRTTR